MVRITYNEDGDIISVEAARARITRPDGRVEEYSGCSAKMAYGPWQVFGLPISEIRDKLSGAILRLLDDDNSTLMALTFLHVADALALSMGGTSPVEDHEPLSQGGS